MPRQRTSAERLAELRMKKDKADARLVALEQRMKDRKHKDDIRRKLILGEHLVELARNDPAIAKFVQDIIRSRVKSLSQQDLFKDYLKGNMS